MLSIPEAVLPETYGKGLLSTLCIMHGVCCEMAWQTRMMIRAIGGSVFWYSLSMSNEFQVSSYMLQNLTRNKLRGFEFLQYAFIFFNSSYKMSIVSLINQALFFSLCLFVIHTEQCGQHIGINTGWSN